MSAFNLGVSFGINNVIVPKGGPKCVPAILDFSATGEVDIDGELVVSSGAIEYLQGVFIDNSQNDVPISIRMGTTQQVVYCPSNSQGYFAILNTNPPHMVATMAQSAGRTVPVFFYNVPIQSNVWSAT